MLADEYIPKGTRFGPLAGKIYREEEVPEDANKKYFWRVSRIYSFFILFRSPLYSFITEI